MTQTMFGINKVVFSAAFLAQSVEAGDIGPVEIGPDDIGPDEIGPYEIGPL